jgi:AAA family ATP:ADP antiporter
MVATFFAFLNDSVTPESVKRLYGVVGFGGVAGGAFGLTIVNAFIEEVSNVGWMIILVAIALVIAGVAVGAGRLVNRVMTQRMEKVPETPKAVKTGNAALEGGKLVFSSGYLLAIVVMVGLYEMVSTIMDFQFTSTVVHYLRGEAIGAHFSRVFAVTNWTAMFVQLFLTSFVMKRLGVGVALLFLPVAALIGSAGFLVAPILLFGSALSTADNGFSYSINQSAKEALYTPTTKDEKYKAKAFIDMFVQRFAKAVAVVLSLGVTTAFKDFSSIRWLSIFTIAILLGWIATVRYAGKRFEELTA